MSQHDMNIANQGYAALRSDLNSALTALATTSLGTARPATVYEGQIWIDSDTPSSTRWTLNLYDGTDDIPLGLIDITNNNFLPALRLEPGGRATLTTVTPVTASDVTAATTVYYTPHKHDAIPIYTGVFFAAHAFSELSLALSSNSGHTGYHQSGKNFDLFVTNDAGTIRLGTGPAWTSDTARGTGGGTTELARLQGVWTNANTMTLRHGSASGNTVSVSANQATYVGTIRCTADGQTEDSEAKRFAWNAYNRVARSMAALEATDNWNYSTSSFRQANGSTANQLDYVVGLPSETVEASVYGHVLNSSATFRNTYVGVGVDSTTVNSARIKIQAQANNAAVALPHAFYTGNPGIGRHYLAWLEWAAGTDTQTWFGDGGGTLFQSGIVGTVWA